MTKLLLTEPVALKLLTLDASIFAQIRVPTIVDIEEYDNRLARAEVAAIGYVVAPDARVDSIWMIVQEDGDLWRWALTDAALYHHAREEHKWLQDVPQIFLTGGQAWIPK